MSFLTSHPVPFRYQQNQYLPISYPLVPQRHFLSPHRVVLLPLPPDINLPLPRMATHRNHVRVEQAKRSNFPPKLQSNAFKFNLDSAVQDAKVMRDYGLKDCVHSASSNAKFRFNAEATTFVPRERATTGPKPISLAPSTPRVSMNDVQYVTDRKKPSLEKTLDCFDSCISGSDTERVESQLSSTVVAPMLQFYVDDGHIDSAIACFRKHNLKYCLIAFPIPKEDDMPELPWAPLLTESYLSCDGLLPGHALVQVLAYLEDHPRINSLDVITGIGLTASALKSQATLNRYITENMLCYSDDWTVIPSHSHSILSLSKVRLNSLTLKEQLERRLNRKMLFEINTFAKSTIYSDVQKAEESIRRQNSAA